MSKKLAIVIAGAVSLGSYEAGVLYEVIHAIGSHNAALPSDDPARIEIDVITGTSAGGMTAAIAAQKLLYEASALSQPYDNAFYRPWVQDIDITGLLALQPDEDPAKSIFSSDCVATIAQKYLTDRYTLTPTPARTPHPAAASAIRLGLSLSNLNGVDYACPTNVGDFCYTCYQDAMVRPLGVATDDQATWETIRMGALSTGAFPFAFRPVEIARASTEYPDSAQTTFSSGPSRRFVYSDGGPFQNQPLGMAKDLVDEIDPDHTHHEERFYLFVSPTPRGSTSHSEFNADGATLLETGKALMGAIFNQAGFQDWITAEEVNAQVRLLDTRAYQLRDQLVEGTLTDEELAPATKALVKLLSPNPDTARERLRTQYAAEYDAVQVKRGPSAADTFIDAILVLETAADLGDKDEMRIYGIVADEDSELAGWALNAFAGFIDRTYRDHDYDVGRTKARQFLTSEQAQQELGIGTYPMDGPYAIRPIAPHLNGLKLKDMDRAKRQEIRDRFVDRVSSVLRQFGLKELVIVGVVTFFIRPQINKLLEL